jgi:hypothetical protein
MKYVLTAKGRALLNCSTRLKGVVVRMNNERHQIAFYEHINSLVGLCDSLTEKTAYTTLGPADGELYMQLCATITAYTRGLEETFNGRDEDSDEGSADDAGPPGDQSPSPEE